MSERPCTTCRWVRDLTERGGQFARCEAPQNDASTKDYTGIPAIAAQHENQWRYKYCDTQRNHAEPPLGCGLTGEWWEPKDA